jgi:prepilin-type N-terminal cleavage/methylation domain-containing protein
MVIALRRRLHLGEHSDEGLTLIEVVVAMMVFAIIALGAAYSIVSTLHSAKDARGREVALNLAAQAIDAARSTTNIFALSSSSQTATVPGDGTVYTVATDVDWVGANGTQSNCSAAGGSLQYKEVNVSVTWPGMVENNPVTADTIVAPQSTINDPTLGTILVSVHNAAGAGVPGVTITTTPALTAAPPVTDADGCSYILKVPAGTYTIGAALSGYIDVNQNVSATSAPTAITVTAGSVGSYGFSMDQASPVSVKYASNYGSAANLPTNLVTSFTSTIGGVDQIAKSAGSFTGQTGVYKLYPADYTVNSGAYFPVTSSSTGCTDVDPTSWPDGVVGGVALTAPAAPEVNPAPGVPATVNVPMGIVSLTVASGARYYTATAVTPPSGSGDPGCTATPTAVYQFGSITPGSGNKVVLALPYGSYTIKTGSLLTNLASLVGTSIALPSGIRGSVSGSTVTLDPRIPS